jgi:hypothetical protein
MMQYSDDARYGALVRLLADRLSALSSMLRSERLRVEKDKLLAPNPPTPTHNTNNNTNALSNGEPNRPSADQVHAAFWYSSLHSFIKSSIPTYNRRHNCLTNTASPSSPTGH